MRGSLWVAFVGLLAVPLAVGQPSAGPETYLEVTTDTLVANVTATSQEVPLAIEFGMGLVECTDDPTIALVVEAVLDPPTDAIRITVPDDVELDGNADLVVISEDFPINYQDETEATVELSGSIEPYEGSLTVTVTFEGGTPEGCAAAGEMPEASDAVTVDVVVVQTVHPGADDAVPAPVPEDDGNSKDSPAGFPVLVALIAAVVVARRR